MTTVNISLPENLQLFIDEQIAGSNYSTASEYINHLIRQAQQQAERERIETLLVGGLRKW